MTEVVVVSEPVYTVVGSPGGTAVLRTPEVMLVRDALDPGVAFDLSTPPPTVVEIGAVARIQEQNVRIGEGPPASVSVGELYVELQGGAVDEFWTA